MKICLLLFICLIVSSCGAKSEESQKNNAKTVTPTPFGTYSANLSNRNENTGQQWESAKEAGEDSVHKWFIEGQDERLKPYREVPKELKNVDFKNFIYLTDKGLPVHLKDGEAEGEDVKNRQYFLAEYRDAYYVDLTGDSQKEAIVVIWYLFGSGSSDGGGETIYFFSPGGSKPRLIGKIETGSSGYGCASKSFLVKNKEITFSQFGRCIKNTMWDENNSGKYYTKDITTRVFHFQAGKLKMISGKVTETELMSLQNGYATEISIEE